MNASSRSSAVRRAILELVGRGHSGAEIRERLGDQADDGDYRYADSLVKVRDEMRAERLSPGRV